MPDVDRAVLRLGVYELLWRDDVPDAVVIDEAVELVKSLSTDESPKFVNGVLGRVVRDRPAATACDSARRRTTAERRTLALGRRTRRARSARDVRCVARDRAALSWRRSCAT